MEVRWGSQQRVQAERCRSLAYLEGEGYGEGGQGEAEVRAGDDSPRFCRRESAIERGLEVDYGEVYLWQCSRVTVIVGSFGARPRDREERAEGDERG
jgi:hypothetical protein